MLDVALLRNQPDVLAAGMARRGVDVDIAALTALDERRRAVRAEAESQRAEQREAGKAIAKLEGAEKEAAIARVAGLAEAYKANLEQADELDAEFEVAWIPLPNVPDSTAADGMTEEDALEIKRWGDIPDFDFEPRDHLELGEAEDLVDVERAAKVSGTRFGFLKGELVVLQLALERWALDMLMPEGFRPVVPPVLVREQALFGTGFFPGDREQVYEIGADELFLVGTSEVSLAAMHLDEIFNAEELPTRYVGVSPCFRREAGTYGKDTRGIFRVHQFDKVEMFSFCHPDTSRDEHDFLLSQEERIVQALELPYRVVNVAAGDLGSSAAKKYDIEAWFPGQSAYREITSTSNTTDYQSRRLKIRFKGDDGNRLVHTLNGTAIAIGRVLIALMENHQQPDGSIRVPEALVPYTGFTAFPAG